MVVITYWITILLLFWAYSGYILVLLIRHLTCGRKKEVSFEISGYPDMVVLVPFYNEESYIERKIDNCRHLKYEGKVSYYFIDGISEDGSSDLVKRSIVDNDNFHYLQSGCRGKILQLNYFLEERREKNAVIVITDADTILECTTLNRIARAFLEDHNLGVVGVTVEPDCSLAVELQYWRDQNLIRFLESNTGCVSMVCAPCYAFRSELMETFPCSCIADDIYIAHYLNCSGYRSGYLVTTKCRELRTPDNRKQFFAHKFRKGNAYLKELYRFFPTVSSMHGWWRVIFCTRFLQMALIPWLLPLNLLCVLHLVQSGYLNDVVVSGAVFFTGLLAASTGLKLYGAEIYTKDIRGISIVPFIAVNLIIIAVSWTFPFTRQTSCYKKFEKCLKQKQLYKTC